MDELIRNMLANLKYKYTYDAENKVYVMLMGTENGSMYVHIVPREDEAYVWIEAVWNGQLPRHALVPVLPVLNELNLHTKFTTLAFDGEKGAVTCHSGFNYAESEVSERQLTLTMQMVMRCLDENIERIMRAAWRAPANCDGKWN